MIRLTRLNEKPFVVNASMVKYIEETPDTIVTLVNKERIVVLESVDEVIEQIIQYERSIRSLGDLLS